MNENLLAQKDKTSIPVWLLAPSDLKELPDKFPKKYSSWITSCDFKATSGESLLIRDAEGNTDAVLLGKGADQSREGGDARQAMGVGKLARSLPAGNYHLENCPTDHQDLAALSWLLGGYKFDRYLSGDKKKPAKNPTLAAPAGVHLDEVLNIAESITQTRDLINTPTNDLGPEELEQAFRSIGEQFKAKTSVIKGDDLLAENFPMVHAVGRASSSAPRLLDMLWGNSGDPKITLVGKGVCFDTGGLNIKPGSSMATMKKDMGGAANVMGLATMIMRAKLPVRLRVLVPAVENSIAGNAFRPGDVLPSRKGISVEIGNTDAEGRLILADALAFADEQSPDYLIDMATLTGAARVALGPELPPFYTYNDDFAADLSKAGMRLNDPVWRMPLWSPYGQMLSSKIADINHISTGGFAGSITAALFLQKFVEKADIWAHFDIFASVATEKPWALPGGEAQAIRTLFDVFSQKFAV